MDGISVGVDRDSFENSIEGRLGLTLERAKEIADFVMEKTKEAYSESMKGKKATKTDADLLMEVYVEYTNEKERAYAMMLTGRFAQSISDMMDKVQRLQNMLQAYKKKREDDGGYGIEGDDIDL